MDREAWRAIVHGVTTEQLTLSLSHFQRPSEEQCKTDFRIALQTIGVWNIYSLTLIHSGIVIPSSQYPCASVRCIQGVVQLNYRKRHQRKITQHFSDGAVSI